MPLLLAVPIISGLVGAFAGAQVDHALNKSDAVPAGYKIPWQVSAVVVLVIALVVFYAIKKILK